MLSEAVTRGLESDVSPSHSRMSIAQSLNPASESEVSARLKEGMMMASILSCRAGTLKLVG